MHAALHVPTFARLAVAAALLAPALGRAHIAEFTATLDTTQEVPAPSGNGTGTGTGQFTLGEDGTMQATVTFQGLTRPAILAHIHQGPPGLAGPIIAGYMVPQPVTTVGTISGPGAVPFSTQEQQQTLFAGGMYFNIHTEPHPGEFPPGNPSGEIRGQIVLNPGPCPCAGQPSPGAFKSCVKQALRGVEKQERKEASVKQMKKVLKKASCGKTKTPNKKVACCLPIAPAQNIVTDSMCAVLKEKQCTNLGGTSAGAGVPCSSNPCAASPSGAFVEASAD